MSEFQRLPSNPHTPANEWAHDVLSQSIPPSQAPSNPNNLTSSALPEIKPGEKLGIIDPATGKPVMSNTFDVPPMRGPAEVKETQPFTAPPLHHPLGDTSTTSTPGNELPGGWGAAQKNETSVAEPERTTTIYQDVSNTLSSVGQAAYGMIPESLKSAISTSPQEPNATQSPAVAQTSVTLPEEQNRQPTLAQNVTNQVSNAASTVSGQVSNAASAMTDQVRSAVNTVANSEPVQSPQTTFNRVTGVATGAAIGAEKTMAENIGFPRDVESQGTTTFVSTTGGVGDLPGHKNETKVALLPEEKQNPNPLAPTTHTGGVGDLPGSANESRVALLPDERNQVDSGNVTRSTTHPAGPGGGVGDLPGAADESKIALMPEERAHPESTLATQTPSSKTETPAVPVKDEPTTTRSGDKSTGAAFLDRNIHTPDISTTAPPSKNTGKFTETGVTPSPTTATTTTSGPTGAPSTTGATTGHLRQTSSGSSTSSVSDGEGGRLKGQDAKAHKKKVGFGAKLKGEMKVLGGKLTKNENKVKEGEAILSGEAQPATKPHA